MKRSLFCILLIVLLLFCSCGNHAAVPTVESIPTETQAEPLPGPERMLSIFATVDEDTPFNTFTPEELGDNNVYELEYYELTDVSIEIDSKSIPLEQAIQNGDITIEELIAHTQIDARNGICMDSFETKLGLTMYVYEYPEYKVQVYYDIFEAPDGRKHQISRFMLLNPELEYSVSTSYIDWDSEYGYQLDREDWGITLELVEATPTSITLHCTHAGGQHFGELQTYSCVIFSEDWVHFLTTEGTAGIPLEKFTLVQNGETTFTIHWADSHGELPAGKYYFSITFEDIYDAASLHPLTRNFNDRQHYTVPFEIK